MSKFIVRNVNRHGNETRVITMHSRGWLPVACLSLTEHAPF